MTWNPSAPSLRPILLLVALIVTTVAPSPSRAAADDATTVHVETPLGAFDIRLLADVAPRTVANFLQYVRDGDYDGSFVHRSEPGFVIQGGGYVFDDGSIGQVPTAAPIANEFGRSNVRGTVAMAKVDGDPDSATSQWFINLVDNSGQLDGRNGGFTVFGEVVGDGMSVVDAIADLTTYSLNNGLTSVPLIDYSSGSLEPENMVFTTFTDTSTGPDPGGAPPLLLRHARKHKWRSYRVGFEDGAATITEKGPVRLPRDADLRVVSRSDFDGDLQPDVLLRAGGQARVGRRRAAVGGWQLVTLVGKKITSRGAVHIPDDPAFELVATADFNRDGNTDILLHDPDEDVWQLYRLDRQEVLSELSLFLGTLPDDVLVSTADFNADNRADFLFRRADGSWRLNASTTNGGYTVSTPRLAKGPGYTVAAVDDFDGDGLTDVMLRNARGRWILYLLDGSKVDKKGSPGLPRDRDWSLVSHADFNGDGKADALLRHADGSWRLHTLDGRKSLRKGNLAMSSDPDLEIASVADFNGDRMADVLLRHARTGRWMLYLVDGEEPAVTDSDTPRLPRNRAWELQRD